MEPRPRREAPGVLRLRVDQADPVDQEVALEGRVAAVLPLACSEEAALAA